jgi:hypothetical protein
MSAQDCCDGKVTFCCLGYSLEDIMRLAKRKINLAHATPDERAQMVSDDPSLKMLLEEVRREEAEQEDELARGIAAARERAARDPASLGKWQHFLPRGEK